MDGGPGSPNGGGVGGDNDSQRQQELAALEQLCETLYAGPNPQERARAQMQLRGFVDSVQCIPQCQLILDSSQNQYALLMASSSLLKLLTTFWNSFSTAQTVEMRDYLLNYLASRCHMLPPYVSKALIKVLMRITKLGWLQDAQHQEICDCVTKFLQHTVRHCIIGMHMLTELVVEMNTQIDAQTITRHRKTSQSFRDLSLKHVFALTITHLTQIQRGELQVENPGQSDQLRGIAFELALKCLGFDYIGTNPDESSEDAGTVQVPTSWRPLIQNPQTVNLFLDMFTSSKPDEASICLEVLVQLAACRRSLFDSGASRAAFMSNICAGICTILTHHQAQLTDPDCYHHFCRMLGRLKSNYQLQELASMSIYPEWIRLVATFTVESLTGRYPDISISSNSLHYLLGFWARVTMAIPYMKGDTPTFLETFLIDVRQSFISKRLDSVPALVRNGEIDELFDQPDLGDHLKQLPSLCRYQYQQTRVFLVEHINALVATYQECIAGLDARPMHQELPLTITVVECKLAVLVYTVGSVISGHMNIPHAQKEDEGDIEAELCAHAFRVMQLTEMRNTKTANNQLPVKKCLYLSLSVVYFLEWFRRSFVGHTDIPCYAYGGSSVRRAADTNDILPQQETVYSRMSAHLGPTTQDAIVTLMLDTIIGNLALWADNTRVVKDCLELLDSLSSGYASAKLMADLPRVKVCLTQHTSAHFPFLDIAGNSRQRTMFYRILGRLVFLQDDLPMFYEFMAPFEQVVHQITTAQGGMRSDVALRLGIGLVRDLRGVLSGAVNRKSYHLCWEWIHPKYTGVILRLLETWWDTPIIVIPVLRFYGELVRHKSQRNHFGTSSPNGILLFKEVSKALNIYGGRMNQLARQRSEDDDEDDGVGSGAAGAAGMFGAGSGGKGEFEGPDVYKKKLKAMSLCMQTFARALSGDYVNFGVFELYNDKALSSALNTVIGQVLTVPLHVSLSYTKVAVNYYALLEILFRNHTALLVQVDSKVFQALFSSLQDGLQGFSSDVLTLCAGAVDHVMCWRWHQARKREPPPGLALLERHLAACGPAVVSEMFRTLMNIVLFENVTTLWSLSRPIFSLMVCVPSVFIDYQQYIATTQPQEALPQLAQAFTGLTAGLQMRCEAPDKDAFAANLRVLKASASGFMVKPAELQ